MSAIEAIDAETRFQFGGVESSPHVADAVLSGLRDAGGATPRAKRALDLVGASLGLLVFAPLIAACVVAVRLTSRGPAFYRQERIGRGGRSFMIVKLRSMRVGTHEQVCGSESYTRNSFKLAGDDPRITPIGRFLRATSLDELPQLLNVLRGEMSLVGVRPVELAQLMERDEADRALYCAMPPGMTGAWQVAGRSLIVGDERHALDSDYVASWSIWADLALLARTPLAVVATRKAT